MRAKIAPSKTIGGRVNNHGMCDGKVAQVLGDSIVELTTVPGRAGASMCVPGIGL